MPYKQDNPEYIYVASSWRNIFQEAVVHLVRAAGHEPYDFMDSEGFHWSDVDPDFKGNGDMNLREFPLPDIEEDFRKYKKALEHPVAQRGFDRDFDAMKRADRCILVLPCGRSAHLELGWFVGQSKLTCVYAPDFDGTWDLMYKMTDLITDSSLELLAWLGVED